MQSSLKSATRVPAFLRNSRRKFSSFTSQRKKREPESAWLRPRRFWIGTMAPSISNRRWVSAQHFVYEYLPRVKIAPECKGKFLRAPDSSRPLPMHAERHLKAYVVHRDSRSRAPRPAI